MLITIITAGGLSMLLLAGGKWLWRTWIIKNPEYDFPTAVYTIGIPVLNILVIPLLALLQIEGYPMPVDWLGWVREAITVLLASLISLVAYNDGLKPLRDYSRSLKSEG